MMAVLVPVPVQGRMRCSMRLAIVGIAITIAININIILIILHIFQCSFFSSMVLRIAKSYRPHFFFTYSPLYIFSHSVSSQRLLAFRMKMVVKSSGKVAKTYIFMHIYRQNRYSTRFRTQTRCMFQFQIVVRKIVIVA